jgi:hypothetical protein
LQNNELEKLITHYKKEGHIIKKDNDMQLKSITLSYDHKINDLMAIISKLE